MARNTQHSPQTQTRHLPTRNGPPSSSKMPGAQFSLLHSGPRPFFFERTAHVVTQSVKLVEPILINSEQHCDVQLSLGEKQIPSKKSYFEQHACSVEPCFLRIFVFSNFHFFELPISWNSCFDRKRVLDGAQRASAATSASPCWKQTILRCRSFICILCAHFPLLDFPCIPF